MSLTPVLPSIKVNDIQLKTSENLWSKMDDASNDSDVITSSYHAHSSKYVEHMKKMKRKESVHMNSKYTALPFHKIISDETSVKMVDVMNVTSKIPRYIVAPDGYIPNSNVREKYPNIFNCDPPEKKKRELMMAEDAEFVKNILNQHLAPDKITDVKKRFESKAIKSIKKPHYESTQKDMLTIQNEVTNDFNFELEQITSEPLSEGKETIKKVKKKKPISKFEFLGSPKTKYKSAKQVTLQEDIISELTEEIGELQLVGDRSEEDIDIDILDTLARQIEEGDKLGITFNLKINERINKDRQLRMDEVEFTRCLAFLEGIYGSKRDMYKDIMKALNRKPEALENLEAHLTSRQRRLEFLNTLTDPRHLFKYLLNFYNDRSELLDNIQDILMGEETVNIKQLTMLCGASYKLKEFFAEFVIVKNYANNILSKKVSSEKDRLMILEKSMRDGVVDEKITFSIFMSSDVDAKRFFECIPECNMKEMTAIIENMKKIKEIQESISVTMTKTPTASSLDSQMKISTASTNTKTVRVDRAVTIILPPLPEYNENSWKLMMSQYIAQMLTNISPGSKTEVDETKTYFDDANLLELIKELSFLHAEVLRLLNVYLSNDAVSAKKLLDGLIAEDELAYKALIELIGEREAMQIIKSLRLKQAKVIEKIIECHGNEQQMSDAKFFLRSMMHNLPPSLTANLATWLDAGHVSAMDINRAVTLLNEKNVPLRFHAADDSKEQQRQLVFSPADRKSRASVTMANLTKDEIENLTVGPLRRASVSYNIDFEYRDIVDREQSTAGILTTEEGYSLHEATETSRVESLYSENVKTQRSVTEPVKSRRHSQETERSEEQKMVESQICQEICNVHWFTAKPTSNYEEMMQNLVELIAKTDDLDNVQEMKSAMVNIAEQKSEQRGKDYITEKLFNDVITLLEQDEESQTFWQSKISRLDLSEATDLIEARTSITKLHVSKKIKIDQVMKSELNKSLEQSIRASYMKNLQIKKLITVMKKFESKKADDLMLVMKSKKFICPLFVPEFNQHISTVRELGMEFFEPHELVDLTPDVIMRNENEEIKRTRIKSNRFDDRVDRLPVEFMSREAFWERASISSRIRDPIAGISETRIDMESDKSSSDSFDILSFDSPLPPKPLSYPAKLPSISPDVNIDEEPELVPPIYKRVSDVSVMTFKPAMTVKQLRKVGEVFTAEYIEDDVIIQDEVSEKYESGFARKFIMKKRSLIKPKDPYFDFHSLYGPNAYYLPYISPQTKKHNRSREDSYPRYSSSNEKENSVYGNVKMLISNEASSRIDSGTILNNSRFLRRPSDVPLNDWIRLGARKMATNMVISDKAYKLDNSKCKYHHLTKLGLHKYGLSASRFIERIDLLEFISKANSATKHEKVKSKLESRLNSKISDSSTLSAEIF